MAPPDPPYGSLVEVLAGRGVIRFIGPTSFAVGKWYGIELEEPKGKNDGSVHGVVYFNCKMGHGMFVKGTQVKVLSEPEVATPQTPRPTLGHNRSGSLSMLARAGSLRSTPPGSSRSQSPAKPSIPTPPPQRVPSTRALAPPTLVPPTPKLSFPPRPFQRRDSAQAAQPERTPDAVPAPQPVPIPVLNQPRVSSPSLSISPPPPPPASPPPPSIASTNHTEEQELRAKLRVLEAKRADDARHIRELETRLSEAESFVAVRPKLQAKLNSLQTDLLSTRRSLQDQTSLLNIAEARLEESADQLEMAMLDKEVAEERAEAAEVELDIVKEKLAVVEVELNVIKEAGEGGISTSGEGAKSSLAYLQLEKHNERLKDALIRLRDLSHETEMEQRRQLAEVERELAGVDDLRAQLDSTLQKLENADMQIEELKIQLDDALGAEEMLVQLTERNLQLGENIEEMRIVIEDLESLKELNDELEETHIESEKALQEEIDHKDSQLRLQARKVESLEDTLQDYEGTINQFRDLVGQLTHELDSMRTQTQTAQSESATAASQSAAVMSLNMKLQSSAAKTQAKNIDLELKKMEAREGRELLAIIQPYLPQIYLDSDSDATNCYLFFQRLACKADLINNVVAQAHGLPDALNGPVSEKLVGVCEMRGRISHLSALCKRFASVLRRCDAASFLSIGRVFPEIAPMEKRIDIHIDLLRREEFREGECVSDVLKMLAQFDHLADSYFAGFEHDLGERELDLVFSFDCDLDMFSAAIGLTKTALEGIMEDDEIITDFSDLDPQVALFEPIQLLLDQCKGAKSLSRKLVKRVEDLTNDSAALKQHLLPQLDSLPIISTKAVDFAIPLAQDVGGYLADIRASKQDFQLSAILAMVRKHASGLVSKRDSSWGTVGEVILQSVQEASTLLPSALEPESVIKITGPSPWVTRVEEIKSSVAVNLDAERKVAQLNEEIQDLVRGIKTRDQTIQETTVKVELMERRMEAVKKQADTIQDLESELSKARKQERAYEEGMEQLQADLDALEQENARLKTANVNAPERQKAGSQPTETETVAVEGNLETSHLLEQIESLRGTVRFLRHENSYLKGQDLLKEIQSLPPLVTPSIPSIPSPSIASPLAGTEQDPAGIHSDSDGEDRDFSSSPPRAPPTLRSLATETKVLYHDLLSFSSSPKVVDLSTLNSVRTGDGQGQKRGWVPQRKTPAHQVWERKLESEKLSRRVKGLMEKVGNLQNAGRPR